jgi:hypothetical protein
MISLEAKCARCGVQVAITDIRSDGNSFVMKPGLTLADLCPVIIDGKKAGDTPPVSGEEDGYECPNLKTAIKTRIEKFRKEHS